MATAFGRAKKVMEQLERLSDQQADDLIDGGYIAAVREAKQSGTLPDQEAFRQFLGLDERLRGMATVDLPARAEPFAAADYFKNRAGLYVWDVFKRRVLAVASTVTTTPATKVTNFKLLKKTIDDGIRAELPEGHVFQGVNIFCSHFAGMIDRQSGGKEGPLLNNGCANIFYVNVGDRVVVVIVGWNAGDQWWGVDACGLRDIVWNAGHCVFSATAVAKAL